MTNFSAIFSYGLIDRQHASFSRDKRWKFYLHCVNVISTLKKRVSMTFLSVTQQIWMCWHWKRTKKWRSRIVLPVNRDHKPPLSTNLERNHHKTRNLDEISKKNSKKPNFGEIFLGSGDPNGGVEPFPLILRPSKVAWRILVPANVIKYRFYHLERTASFCLGIFV